MIIETIEYFFPKNKISYKELGKRNPEWKMSKTHKVTGIKNIYYADKNQTSLDLAISAVKKFKNFKSLKNDVDGIIFCTQTPNRFLPSNSSILHGKLGFKEDCFTLDINHGCSGFVYAISLAKKFLDTNNYKNILIINSDTYSKLINPKDRMTKVIFSDAASATIIKQSKTKKKFSVFYGSSGENYEKLTYCKNGFEKKKKVKNYLHMDGMGIMSFVNSKVPKQINMLLKKNRLSKKKIDFFIFHQASKLAIDSLIRILEIEREKVIFDLEDGNTVSSSIPIALKKAQKMKKIKKGDKIILSGFGVGLSWASALIEY